MAETRPSAERGGADTVAGRKSVLVLHKVRQVLDAFTADSPQLTAREAQRRTALPATTILRLLHSLVDEGFLERHGDRYRLGLSLLRWARSATEAVDLVDVARQVLAALRDRTGESACLLVRHGSHHACIAMEETLHPVIQILHVGQVLPLHAGTAGRVFLADDDAAAEELPSGELPAFTEHSISARSALGCLVQQTRDDGYAVSAEEPSVGAASVSAPVLDHTEALAALLCIAGPVQRFGADAVSDYARQVVAAAEDSLPAARLPLATTQEGSMRITTMSGWEVAHATGCRQARLPSIIVG